MNEKLGVKIPIVRIVRLLGKAIRFSKQGYTKEEKRELGLDLAALGADILEDVIDG